MKGRCCNMYQMGNFSLCMIDMEQGSEESKWIT